ncbi:hypothetical protein B0H14DRAFT_3496495 [Mycena olivaceomarginata]|nr:hypothetical protein B0H14DRAFT_3496495 [Mycena olivaceomarginata]
MSCRSRRRVADSSRIGSDSRSAKQAASALPQAADALPRFGAGDVESIGSRDIRAADECTDTALPAGHTLRPRLLLLLHNRELLSRERLDALVFLPTCWPTSIQHAVCDEAIIFPSPALSTLCALSPNRAPSPSSFQATHCAWRHPSATITPSLTAASLRAAAPNTAGPVAFLVQIRVLGGAAAAWQAPVDGYVHHPRLALKLLTWRS